tara:strand:+ start:2252 stop:2536 length:285 start_codon:yes stop_codon:yes gene_type:complete
MTTAELNMVTELSEMLTRTGQLLKDLAGTKGKSDKWTLLPRGTSRTRTEAERCADTQFSRSTIQNHPDIRTERREGRIYYSVTDALAVFNQPQS